MSLGLFVEGPSDRDTIPILIRKLGYRSRVRARVVRQSEMLLPDRMARNVEEMLRARRDIDLIVVCIDSERVAPSVTEQRMRPIQRRLNETSSVPISYVVVDHALEGWLACDEQAIRAVLGPRARINIRGNPEDHPTPADILHRIYRDNRREFSKMRDNRRIAENVSPERIAARSPTFRRFAEILGHPISV